jgi:hypothetical protein
MDNWFQLGVLIAALTALFMAVGYRVAGSRGMLADLGRGVEILGLLAADAAVLTTISSRRGSYASHANLRYAAFYRFDVYVIDSDQPLPGAACS